MRCNYYLASVIIIAGFLSSCAKENPIEPPKEDIFTVTDVDGNNYPVIIIGGNEWMAENLRTTRYNNGDKVISGLSDREWQDSFGIGAYSIYPHDGVGGIDSDEAMMEAYGLLYNYFALIDSRGLCPQGWRGASFQDWVALVEAVESRGYGTDHDDPNSVGNALKSKFQVGNPAGSPYDNESHPRWDAHEIHNGLDSYGFGALPSGSRFANGSYFGLGQVTNWWPMASRIPVEYNNIIGFYYASGSFMTGGGDSARSGWPVRCVRDR